MADDVPSTAANSAPLRHSSAFCTFNGWQSRDARMKKRPKHFGRFSKIG
jgi:hypothetical protein